VNPFLAVLLVLVIGLTRVVTTCPEYAYADALRMQETRMTPVETNRRRKLWVTMTIATYVAAVMTDLH